MSSLLHATGQFFMLAVAIITCGSVLKGMATAALTPSGRTASGRTGSRAFRSPGARAAGKAGKSTAAVIAHPGNRQIRAKARADAHTLWEGVRSTDWLEERRHARRLTAAAGTPVTFTDPSPSPEGGIITGITGNGGMTGMTGGNGSTPPARPQNGINGGKTMACDPSHVNCPVCGKCMSCHPHPAHVPQATTSPATTSTTNGGTVAAGTSTASAEKLIEGINEIHAHAAAGGIHAKREAIKAAHEGAIRFAAMLAMLARQMAEPGQNYGHEITEPLAKGAQNLQATAMSVSESDASLSTLINTTVGELATSPRQAPHHSELSESGAR